jgi:hypothetical protein
VLFQSAIDFLSGISVSRTNADFSSILDS